MSVIYENGQVVIPKHLRKRFNLTPGSRVRFYEKDNKLVMEPEYDVLAEFEALCSDGTLSNLSDKEVDELIKKTEEKRKKEILNVP